jgi:hypothetical protein
MSERRLQTGGRETGGGSGRRLERGSGMGSERWEERKKEGGARTVSGSKKKKSRFSKKRRPATTPAFVFTVL